MLTYFLAWFPMLLLAILNGVLREAVFKKWMAEATAHQVSTLTLLFVLGVYIRYIVVHFPPASSMQAILIGAFWAILTLVFEFGFGLYRGHTWSAMLADYNILQGRLWLFVPVWITIAPVIYFQLLEKAP